MKLFDEQKLVNENITIQNRLDYKYYLLDPMFNYLQELDFLQNVVINRKINTISELSFTTPATLEDGNINVLNLIRSHYIVQAKSSTHSLYFLVMKQDIRVSKNEKDISFQVLEYPRQLAKDIIHEYEEVSKTIAEVTDEILKESSWKVTYIDSDFINKKRSFSFKQQTALESLQNIAQMFNALIEWDIPNKEISFINPNRLRVNRGLVLNSEKYLEGVNLEVNSEEIITRLYLYGKDNLSIEKLTPTGGRYLEDFSWFMKPFEMDEEGNVLKSSNYMTDELCISLVNYQQLLKNNNGLFESYLDELDELEDRAFETWLNTTELKIDLSIITEELDVLNSTNGSITEINNVITQKIAKEREVEESEDILESIENDMKFVENQIQELNLLLKRENNFTKEQLLELDNFTIQRVFQDTSIEDAKDLLEDGLELFKTINRPTIKTSIDITNFYNNSDYKFDWGKLQFGELVTTEIEDLGVDVIAQVTEENYNEENQTISVVLQNEHSSIFAHENDMTKLLYDSHSSSTTVNMDKYKWDLAEEANDGVSKILNNAWNAAKNQIQGGVEQSVTISERGLIIRSSDNPNHLLIAQNGVLGLSRDNGNTWRTAITPEGVFAETIVGRLIMGNKLIIEDENGIIKITGDQQVIYDPQENEKVILGKLDNKGNYGIRIKQGAFHLEGGITEGDMNPELIEYLQFDDTELRGDLRLEAPLPNNIKLDGLGITATSSGDPNKFARLDYRGLYAQGGAIDVRTGTASNRGVIFDGSGIRGYNSSGIKTFELDTNGNLTANTGTFGGSLNAATGTFSGNLSAVGGTFTGTLSGVDGTFTGTLSGNDITGSNITGSNITGSEFRTTGSNGQFLYLADGYLTAYFSPGSFSESVEITSRHVKVTHGDNSAGRAHATFTSGGINFTTSGNINTDYKYNQITSNREFYFNTSGLNLTGAGTISMEGSTVNMNRSNLELRNGSLDVTGTNISGLTGDKVRGVLRVSDSHTGSFLSWNSAGKLQLTTASGAVFYYTADD